MPCLSPSLISLASARERKRCVQTDPIDNDWNYLWDIYPRPIDIRRLLQLCNRFQATYQQCSESTCIESVSRRRISMHDGHSIRGEVHRRHRAVGRHSNRNSERRVSTRWDSVDPILERALQSSALDPFSNRIRPSMRNYQQITGEDRKMLHFIVRLSSLCASEDCLFPFVIIDKEKATNWVSFFLSPSLFLSQW